MDLRGEKMAASSGTERKGLVTRRAGAEEQRMGRGAGGSSLSQGVPGGGAVRGLQLDCKHSSVM